MHSRNTQSRWPGWRWPPRHVPRSPSTKTRVSKGDPSTPAGRSPISNASASTTAPHRSSSPAIAGRSARTSHSMAAASCCAKASTLRSRRPADRHSQCATLHKRAQPGASGLLGRHLYLPRLRAPRADDRPGRTDRDRQPRRRAQRLTPSRRPGGQRRSVVSACAGASSGSLAMRSYSAITCAPSNSKVAASSRLSSTAIAVVNDP